MSNFRGKESKLPVVAIVGRVNIGKSSLFNVIMHRRVSIVHEQVGVTRDRVSMPAYWKNYNFLLVDTGGLGIMRDKKKGDFFDLEIRKQLEASLENVKIVIVVTNVQEGITIMDREVVKFMQEKNKKCIMACNKADNQDLANNLDEFYQLGIKDITAISCTHRYQIDVLLDNLIKYLPKVEKDKDKTDVYLSTVGRPNVGKSSIINALLGEERVIVSDIAGTTRDTIDIPFTYVDNRKNYLGILIDTAGVKRRGKVDNLVDMFSIMRTEDAIKRSSVVLFVIDASMGVMNHDKKIGSLILKYGRPCIIIVNKWDLKKGSIKKKDFEEEIFYNLPFINYAPLIFISALEKIGLEKILEQVILVNEQANIKAPTSLVNHVLQDIVKRTPPSSTGKGFFKIFYGLMTKNPPANFIIFCNHVNYLQKSYLTFIEKQLRRAFSLTGIPIEIHLREKENSQDSSRFNDMPKKIKAKLSIEREKVYFRNKKYRK